jgi:uncharacterized membrane protein
MICSVTIMYIIIYFHINWLVLCLVTAITYVFVSEDFSLKASVFIIILQVQIRLNIIRAFGSPEKRCIGSWMKGLIECAFYHIPCSSSVWKCQNFMTALYISPPDITESFVCLYVTVGSSCLSCQKRRHMATVPYLLYTFVTVAPFVKIKMSWNVMPCQLVNIYRYFSKA